MFRRTVSIGILLSNMLVAFADGQPKGPPVAPLSSHGGGGEVGTFADQGITVEGKDRFYRLVVPKSVNPAQPVPLVFAFHGLFDSKDLMPFYSKIG